MSDRKVGELRKLSYWLFLIPVTLCLQIAVFTGNKWQEEAHCWDLKLFSGRKYNLDGDQRASGGWTCVFLIVFPIKQPVSCVSRGRERGAIAEAV